GSVRSSYRQGAHRQTAGTSCWLEPAGWAVLPFGYLTSFLLTPLRRPDRSGASDSWSAGSGFVERSIDFHGSSRPRSHSEMFRMPTPSGRSPSLSTSDHAIGTAMGAPRRARTAYGAT